MADLQNKFQIIGLTSKCIDDILALSDDSAVYKKLLPAIRSFNTDHTQLTLNFEVISSKSKITNLYSIRLSQGIRAILCNWRENGQLIKNQFLIIHVEEDHDKSYAWANKVKSADIEKYLNQEILKVVLEEDEILVNDNEQDDSVILPFATLSDSVLKEIDVDKSIYDFLRKISMPAFIDGKVILCKSMHEYSYETLSAVAQGLCDDEQDIIDFFDSEKSAFIKTQSLIGGFEVVDRDKELREAIESCDFEKFRLFLHPQQAELVDSDYKGPVRILGGAGTGKTVVAMYRAKRLASKLDKNEKLLFCTYTNSLIDDLSKQLKRICTEEEYSHIEVCTLSSLVNAFWKERGSVVLYDETKLDSILGKAIWENSDSSLKGKTCSFYHDEIDQVIMQLNNVTEEEYLLADRSGRGEAISQAQRKRIFKIIMTYMDMMEAAKKIDYPTATAKMASICNSENTHPYKHIIVDECQDFHAVDYRLIRALTGEQHENDVFLAGDLRQAIYKKKAVLSNCGIDIRGRGKYLYINYRTTAGISKYAEKIIHGIDFSESDSGCKQISDKTMSLIYGNAPVLQSFDSVDQEAGFIISHINNLHNTQNVPYENICICMLSKSDIDLYKSYFTKAKIQLLDVHNLTKVDAKGKVHFSTCHNIKGLEYQYIILVNASEKHFETASSEERRDTTKKLLYVAITRAQRSVLITAPGPITKLLPQK